MAQPTSNAPRGNPQGSCPNCEAHIPPDADLPYTCADCGYTFCPFCWARSGGPEYVEYCEHVLAAGSTGDDEWYESPFSDGELPYLDELPSVGYWSAEQKYACFGDLTPLLECYEDFHGLDAEPRKHEIVDKLVSMYSLPVLSSFRMDFAMGSLGAEFEYFASDVAPVRRVLDDALSRLRLSFQQLVQLQPSSDLRAPKSLTNY